MASSERWPSRRIAAVSGPCCEPSVGVNADQPRRDVMTERASRSWWTGVMLGCAATLGGRPQWCRRRCRTPSPTLGCGAHGCATLRVQPLIVPALCMSGRRNRPSWRSCSFDSRCPRTPTGLRQAHPAKAASTRSLGKLRDTGQMLAERDTRSSVGSLRVRPNRERPTGSIELSRCSTASPPAGTFPPQARP
jgi:hypothetical protein